MSAELEFIQSKTLANFPFVAQIDSSDCGAACLAMVAQFFKKDLILSEARQQCGNDVTGQRICKVANKIGLKVDFGESATDECWLFTRGFFDGELLFDREFRVIDE